MARIRTVKPEFWGHPKTSKVSRDARLLFLGLLNFADDEGRLLASPRAIAGYVFPNDFDVTVKDITDWMTELAQVGFVHLYVLDGVTYCLVRGFGEHQKVSHPTPSRLPPPPEETAGHEPQENLANGSGATPEVLRPDLGSGSRIKDLGGGGDHSPWRCAAVELMPRQSDPPLIEEAEIVLATFGDSYPIGDVELAVQQLRDDRRRFPFPSNLRTALANLLGPPKATPQASPLDDTARAARRLAEEGNAQVEALRDVRPDPERNASGLAAARASLRKPGDAA